MALARGSNRPLFLSGSMTRAALGRQRPAFAQGFRLRKGFDGQDRPASACRYSELDQWR